MSPSVVVGVVVVGVLSLVHAVHAVLIHSKHE